MVCFRVGTGAEGAEGSLEWADLGIRMMTELPAPSALGEANAFFGRGDDEAVPAIHKRLADKVLHWETATGVMDVEQHHPRIRGARVPREVRGVSFIEVNGSTQRRLHEDLVHCHPRDREETSVATTSGFQFMVREIAYLEARFRGGDLALQLAVRGLLCISKEGLKNL